jgi:integrase
VFPKLGDVLAEDVKRADLLAITDDAKADGKQRTAQVLFSDMSQMFSFAAEREIVPFNPLDAVKKRKAVGKSAERARELSGELEDLACALPGAGLSPRNECAVWLILATGVRVGECMGACWSDDVTDARALQAAAAEVGAHFGVIDARARTWYLPTSKNQRDHTIHLSDFALRQIERLAELREVGADGQPVPWVFPSTDAARPVCIKSFGKQLSDRQREPERRMQGRSKATRSLCLPGGRWTAHDLRRTAATLMVQLGVYSGVIDECLNHMQESKVARTYQQDRRLPQQRVAFDALGQRLASIGDDVAPSNVVPLRSA